MVCKFGEDQVTAAKPIVKITRVFAFANARRTCRRGAPLNRTRRMYDKRIRMRFLTCVVFSFLSLTEFNSLKIDNEKDEAISGSEESSNVENWHGSGYRKTLARYN